MKKTAIVILNFNGEKDTRDCLKSIDSLLLGNSKLLTIIVDNGSKEKFSNENIKFKNGDLNIIRNEENLGFAYGNNVGIKHAIKEGADYIMVLNNDTFLNKNILIELMRVVETNDQIGIVGPKIYFAKGYEFHKNRYKKDDRGKVIWYAGGILDWKNLIWYHRGVDEVENGQFDKIYETDFASGCCMFVKKEVFKKLGFFDEKYFMYYEDIDFNIKAKKSGYKIIFVPSALMWHKNAQSSGGSGSDFQDYYITRNRLIFGLKYASLKAKFHLIKESLLMLKNGRKWQKRGVRDFYLRKLGKGNYNV